MISPDVAKTMLNASPDAMLLVDQAGTIRFANASAEDMFGYALTELNGMPVEQLVPRAARGGHVALRKTYTEHPTKRPMDTGLDLHAVRSDGTEVSVEISLSPVTVDGELHTVVTARDVMERRRAAARIALLNDRQRIARDLHDMVIQRIFAAGMSLQAISGLAEPPLVRSRVEVVIDELDDTIRELRSAIFALGIPDVEQSLAAHIAAVINERSHHLGFTPELVVRGDVDAVPDYVGEQLVATLIESLSNMARHASASAATIDISLAEGELSLTVTDDGVGIGAAPKANGGLANMVWRATELGGVCSVRPGIPGGTVVDWTVPV